MTFVYVPEVPTFGIDIVPVVVIVPPDSPVPAVILVTVPPALLSPAGAQVVPLYFNTSPEVADILDRSSPAIVPLRILALVTTLSDIVVDNPAPVVVTSPVKAAGV